MTPRNCTDCGAWLTDDGTGLDSEEVCADGLWHNVELTRWERLIVRCYGFRLPKVEFRVIGWDGYVKAKK